MNAIWFEFVFAPNHLLIVEWTASLGFVMSLIERTKDLWLLGIFTILFDELRQIKCF